MWSLLAKQEEDAEVLEGLENIPKQSIHERIVEQTVNVPVPHVEPAVSSGAVPTSQQS